MTDEEKKAQEAAEAAAAQAQETAGEAGGEAGAETGAQGGNGGEGGEGGEQKPEKSPRDIIYERVRTSRPDAKYDEDDQEVYRQLESMLDDAEDGSAKYKDFTGKLMRRYETAPEEVAALLDFVEGKPLIAAIRENMGDEALSLKEGDEGWDEYQKAGERRKADRERYDSMMKEVKSNMDATVSSFDAWASKNNLDDEQRDKIWETMNKDLDKMSRGIFDEEIYNRYFKAENYDNDVDGAREQGEADGKNKAIEAKREQMKGSGLPGGVSGGSVKPQEERKENPTATWLAGFRHR